MAKVAKLMKRLESTFADRNFYEAHQIARTIYHRELETNEYEKLSRFLYEKALEFVEVDEMTSALDLADLYAQTLSKGGLPMTDERLQQVETLFEKLPTTLRSSTDTKERDCRTTLANRLMRWSAEVEPSKQTTSGLGGDRRVAQLVAPTFARIRREKLAEAKSSEDDEEESEVTPSRDLIHDDLD